MGKTAKTAEPIAKVEKFKSESFMANISDLKLREQKADVRSDENQWDINNKEDRALMDSIKVNGIMDSLSVYRDPKETGKLIVVNGRRRFAAAQALGLKTVPVTTTEAKNAYQYYMKALESNVHSKAMSKSEVLDAIAKLRAMDKDGTKNSESAIRRLGFGASTEGLYKTIAKVFAPLGAERLALLVDTLPIASIRALMAVKDVGKDPVKVAKNLLDSPEGKQAAEELKSAKKSGSNGSSTKAGKKQTGPAARALAASASKATGAGKPKGDPKPAKVDKVSSDKLTDYLNGRLTYYRTAIKTASKTGVSIDAINGQIACLLDIGKHFTLQVK